MKKPLVQIAPLLATAMLITSLVGCTTTPKKETERVKCPACGYEFQVPTGGNSK
jgi:hypothetical protein